MKQERKTERSGPVVMRDEAGNEYPVFVEIALMRQQYLDGSWSQWEEMSKRFFTSDSPVNPPDQGWFEHVASGTKIRP